MTTIDKTRAKFIMTELSLVLKDFAAKHDLVSAPFKLRYSATDYQARIKLIEKNAVPAGTNPLVAQRMNKEAVTYLANYRRLGLPDLGTKIRVKGMILKIEGMRIKNVSLINVDTNRRYKMKIDGVKNAERIPS